MSFTQNPKNKLKMDKVSNHFEAADSSVPKNSVKTSAISHLNGRCRCWQTAKMRSRLPQEIIEDNLSGIYTIYICNVCKKPYRTIKTTYQTWNRNADLKLNYKCKKCEELFETKADHRQHWLSTHKRKNISSSRQISTQPVSSVTRQQSSTLQTSKRNARVHFGTGQHPGSELDFEFGCMQCDEFFKTIEDVKRHTKLKHELTEGRLAGLFEHNDQDSSGSNSTKSSTFLANKAIKCELEIKKEAEDNIDVELLSENNFEGVIKEELLFEIEDYNHY